MKFGTGQNSKLPLFEIYYEENKKKSHRQGEVICKTYI